MGGFVNTAEMLRARLQEGNQSVQYITLTSHSRRHSLEHSPDQVLKSGYIVEFIMLNRFKLNSTLET